MKNMYLEAFLPSISRQCPPKMVVPPNMMQRRTRSRVVDHCARSGWGGS